MEKKGLDGTGMWELLRYRAQLADEFALLLSRFGKTIGDRLNDHNGNLSPRRSNSDERRSIDARMRIEDRFALDREQRPEFALHAMCHPSATPKTILVIQVSNISHAVPNAIAFMNLAKSIGLSPAAFSRVFAKATGARFVDYVNNLRIGHACRMLIETDLPITEISHRAGFHNLSNFNRTFLKRRGMAPREFRREYQG